MAQIGVTCLLDCVIVDVDALRARGAVSAEVEAFGWQLEEARIAAFAPELKPAALPMARMADEWTRIGAG